MGMTFKIFWEIFCYGVKREHYEKLIAIGSFLDLIALDLFGNYFSIDNGTPGGNIHLLDEVNDVDPVSTHNHINFCTSVSLYMHEGTVPGLTVTSSSSLKYSLSTYTLHSHHNVVKI